MPGIVGAASHGARRVDGLPFDEVLARLRHQPKMVTSFVTAPDARAAIGAVDLAVFVGSGSSWADDDGSLAVVHGEILRPEPTYDLARVLLERYRADPTSLCRVE